MQQTMNKVVVYILLSLSFTVYKSHLKSVRSRRSDAIDFDKLSDDDVFALLEKPDDYEFQTEKDIDFNFDGDDDEDEDLITQFSTEQSPDASLSPTELNHEFSPAIKSAYDGKNKIVLSTAVPILETISSFISELPSTEQSSDDLSSKSPNYSANADSSSTPDMIDRDNTPSSTISTDLTPVDAVTEEAVLVTTEVDSSTFDAVESSTTTKNGDVSASSKFTTESKTITSLKITGTETTTIPISSLKLESTPNTHATTLLTTLETIPIIPQESTVQSSTLATSTIETRRTTLSIPTIPKTTKPIPTNRKTSKPTQTSKITIKTPQTTKITAKPTQTTKITTKTTQTTKIKKATTKKESYVKTTIAPKQRTASKRVVITKSPTTLLLTSILTTVMPTTSSARITTSSPSTTVNPVPPYLVPGPNTSDSGQICFKLMRPDNTVSDECFFPMGIYPAGGQTSSPSTTIKRVFTTSTAKTSAKTTATTTTTESSSTTAKRTEKAHGEPSTYTSDSGQVCFKLMKDDNAVSDDCFFPMGVYPVGGQTSKPITTMKRIFSTTTTESTTAKRTENPTSRRGEGGICFMRVNSNNKSECFYLDLNPSEAPRTETIATLAPHRIFEITEEPPPLPIETVSLLNPPVVVNQRPVGSGSATFAPDRIFEIPISGVNTKTKSQKPDGKSNAGNRYGQGGVDLRRVAPTTPGKPGWNILRAEHSLIQAGGKNEVRFQPRKSESIPYNERRNHNRFSHLIVGNGGTYNLRVNPEAGQKTDDQWDQSSSGNRSVLPLPRENPRSHQEGPRHPSRGGYSSTFLVGDGYQTKNRRPIGEAPLSYDNVVLIPTNDRRVQYPTSNLDMLSRDRSQLMPPVNRGYNEEAQVSNVRVNTLVPQAENNRNHAFLIPAERRMGGNYNPTFADDIRVYYPTIHLNRSAANRSPLTLVPVNPRYVQEEMVSNVRVNARYPQIGNRNVNYEDNRRNHQAFMIPVDRRSGEPGLSNIRIQLPQQGTFSQHAHVSNSDSQRSNFEHLYLGVHKGRPHEFDQRSRHTRAVKARPSIEETEAISLAFVVDTTASMNTELNEVKYYVSIIMDEVLNNRGSHIGNFIFVPIHDEIPAHEDYLVTRDRSKMAQTISAIRVSGGGKCPENSLIGLLKAIELSEKDSHIFLFTDAYAKDYNLVPTIIGMIQRKKPRVYFLLTGECKKPDNNAQKYAFDKIAAASTGIVARLVTDKTGEWSSMQLQKELHAVLEAVAREFEKNRRIVTEHEGSPTGTGSEDIKISVDPGLTNLSLTSTGHNTKINVTGPKGPPKDIVKVLDMPNIQILSVPKPDPGEWTVSVTSPESPFKIVASGISTTDFLYGFSVSPTIDTTRLSKHPMQGVRNHLLLVAKDPSVLANISNVQLVIGNRVFTTLPISVSNKERGIYSGGPILFPNDSFKIRINAFTKEGYPLTRLTKATIVPQMPGPPEIDCKKRMVATAGFPFNMTCSVESLIRMDIQIFKIGASSAHTVTHSHTSTVVLNFPQLEKKDSGTYIIQANNSAGFADQEIYLEVQAIAPTVNLVPEFVSFPGKRLVIKCDVSSYIDYTVSWSKKEAPIDNFYRTGAFNLIGNDDLKIQNDTIIIDPVRPEDKGWYICTARNEGGKKSARTYLTIQEKPSVSIERFNEYFRKGDRISLICRADKGIPVVSLSWYDNYGVVEPDSAIFTNKRVTQRRDGSLELLINDANKQDSGTYTCFGRNDAGRDSKPAVLQYVEKPIVEAREPRVQALTGERLTLECSCTGFPTPNITWSRMSSGSPNRTPLESNRKDSPGKYLEIEAVDRWDAGMYICTATNGGGYDEDWIEVVIGEKPHINRLNKQYKANIYHPAEMSCAASGVPNPVITWYHVRPDGTSIPIRENTIDGVLRIDRTQLENGGTYVCVAQNPFGRAESSTVLTVLGAVKPRISKTGELEVLKSVASKTVTLMCSVTESLPPPTIKWYLKERPVQDFAGMIVSKEDGSLTITNFHSDLSGNYTCVAENPAGSDNKTIFLNLYELPVIEALPATKTVEEGERFFIVCHARGDPEPEITWLREGRLLTDSKELVIERVQKSDAGKYICRANNTAGIDQTDFNLGVLTLPRIKDWEESKYVKKGEIVKLHCDADGNPKPNITWLKNNETIRRISIEHYRFEASIYSAGVYSCIARNDVGESRVDTNIIVLVTPLIQDIPEFTEVKAGDPVDLKCSAIGNPYPSLSWQFRGETLVKQDVGNDSAVLHIQHVSESDAGTYFCLANSSVGYDRRNTTLKVLQPPKIKCSEDIYRAVPNENTEIHCDVRAVPPASVIWYKDDRGFGYVRDDGTLEFVANEEDSGPLKIVAINRAGYDEQTVNLVVLKPPSFSEPSTSIPALVGTNVSLPCDAQGDPKPNITWAQYNYPVLPNKLVFNPASGELHILNVELDDDGAYTCTAKNRVGHSSHTVYLNVLSEPKAEIKSWDLKDGTIREGKELTLICDFSGQPKPRLTWTKDGFPLSESNFIRSSNKLKLITTSDSSGLYACTAENIVGQETSSVFINVTTKPSIDHPEDQSVTELEGRSLDLDCVVHGNPTPSVTWLRNGTVLRVFPDFRVDKDKLVISNLTTSMEGSFTCQASNYLGVEEKLFKVTVNSIPVIKTDVPERINLYQFDDYAIPCRADGKPVPSVYWKIRGEQYTPGSRNDGEKFIIRNDGTLLIKNVSIEDAGKFKCYAKNEEGESSKSHEITVIVPSDVTASLSAEVATVQERASKRLVCPFGKGAWLKNGEPLDTRNPRGDDPHYSLKENGKVLLISDASDTDFAVFSCESPEGTRHDFNVRVLSRPAMYQMPFGEEEYLVSDGDTLVVNCSAKGYPEPRVAWHKKDPAFGWIPFSEYTIDGVKISGTQTEILSFPEVRLQHNGTYRCTSRNDQGNEAREFTVHWSGPPQLKGEPKVTKKIAVDKTLELSCQMEGSPDSSYSWKFLRSGGPEKQVPEVLHFKKNVLVINRITPEEAGEYTCEASNEAGSAVQIFEVHVIEAPQLTRSSVTPLTYKTYEEIELNCTSRTTNNDEVDIHWMKEGIFIIKSERTTLKSAKNPNGTTTHSLRVVNASKDDSGVYKCFVSNIAGEVHQMFIVTVIVPPQLIPASSNIEVELGRPLSFNCSVTYETKIEVEWKKDGHPLGEEKLYGDDVVIDETTMSDGGEYVCVVRNDGEAISVTKYVKILVPPRILFMGPPLGSDHALKSGGKLELGCVAEGDPPPTLSWSRNGENIENETSDNFWVSADRSKLVKENVTEDDKGIYSCFAVSRVSPPAESNYQIIVYAPPEEHFPRGTYSNLTVQYNRSLELECPLSDFSNKISWYKSNQLLEDESLPHIKIKPELTTIKISTAYPEDSGVFICRIEGNYAVREYTFSVTVTVPYHWNNWAEWSACSHTCGVGEQVRTRACVPPSELTLLDSQQFVRLVNDSCSGMTKERRRCVNSPCPIDGGLSQWSSWEECSSSCGDGFQRRYRNCDEPLPSAGGRPCTDPLMEERICSSNPCPVHGGWSEWSEWSGCSASCGYSVKYRDRLCNNPSPNHGGNYCEGAERRQEEACETPACPGEGIWGEWSAWSNCSRPCGTQGFKRRTRICLNKKCDHYDKNTERKRCIVGQDVRPCRGRLPSRHRRSVELLVNGLLNDQLIVDHKIHVTAHRNGTISMNSTNPLKIKHAWFPYINFLVPPITWNIAEELSDSANGYTISQGNFKHIAYYSFSTGEVLKVESTGKGLDLGRSPKLIILVNILGSTPEAMLTEDISISSYDDSLVQRGDALFNTGSNGEILLNGDPIEYTWNSTIELEEYPKKGIIYPVKNVKTDNIEVTYDDANDSIWYSSSSTISYKLRDRDCPDGFILDSTNDHCQDVDECTEGHKCLYTQLCKNIVGSFECHCPKGLAWNSTINMCQVSGHGENKAPLNAPEVILSCAPGFERIGVHCQDIDECDVSKSPCSLEEQCVNTEGSYQCISSPCHHPAAERLRDGTCLTWCNGSFSCESGATVSEIFKNIYVQLQFVEPFTEIARLLMPVKSDDSYTTFTINSNKKGLDFRIRHEENYDVLYSMAESMVTEGITVTIMEIVYDKDDETESTGEFTVHIVNGQQHHRRKTKRKRRRRSN